MEKAELEKLGAAALADIVHAELIALDELIDIQQNEIDEQQFTAFKPLAHRPKPMLAKP